MQNRERVCFGEDLFFYQRRKKWLFGFGHPYILARNGSSPQRASHNLLEWLCQIDGSSFHTKPNLASRSKLIPRLTASLLFCMFASSIFPYNCPPPLDFRNEKFRNSNLKTTNTNKTKKCWLMSFFLTVDKNETFTRASNPPPPPLPYPLPFLLQLSSPACS